MTETRIKISSIIENQLPQFVVEEFPRVSEFLSQYYLSLENQGGTSDILQNIVQYIKVDNLTNLIESANLSSNATSFDLSISVDSTLGFPDSYGLLLIDSEIITYKSKNSTTFEGCVRGFSGITSYKVKDQLVFSETESQEHITVDSKGNPTKVLNLSILFLKEFLNKVKKQFTPGFEDRELYSELNQNIFIKQSIDFYSSKGTDNSFKILFGALYGENVEVIRPRDYLIRPSDAQHRTTSDLVVELIEGNPEDLVNTTLYQDETDFIDKAQGTITKIEKIRRDNKNYYIISLDSDYDKDIQPIGTVYGKFNIHPKTKLISPANLQSTTLEVDSTVAFPNENGNLIIDLENGTSLNVTYHTKTLNQFLGCSGITQNIPEYTEIKSDSYAYGYSKNQIVKLRILGVLSELKIPEKTLFYSKDDTIRIKSLGSNLKDYKSNNWFFNISVKYSVESISITDSSDLSYVVTVYDDHSFHIGDYITLQSSLGDEKFGYVTFINNKKSFSIQFGPENSLLNLNLTYDIKKNLSKVLAKNYPTVNQYTSNIQNIYHDDRSLYIASPSLPTYFKQPLEITDRSVTFSGIFRPDNEFDLKKGTTLNVGIHGMYTGDAIIYKPSQTNNLGISSGVYFIKKIDESKIKLAKSRSNIFTNNYVSVSGSVVNAKFELESFTYRDFSTQFLESQKLIRKISDPEIDGKIYNTDPGLTGIFINGVELLNYKSKDNIYYGPIEKIITTASGSDYNIINPPTLNISDPIGVGAKGHCSVIGNLKRIDIIDPGFDYLEDPTIEIIGGNGFGAVAKANLISFDHSVSFNSIESSELVKLNPINTIEFNDYHKFRDAEEIIYITDNQNALSGLSTNSSYFVSVQDAYKVKLHKSFLDAVTGINTIQITSYGIGNHSFKSKNKKKKVGSITIQDAGSGYQNKLTTTNTIGINTVSDTITILNHGYQSGEIITYNATQNPIGGISSSSEYYVTKVNDDQFKLSSIGISTLGFTTSFFYDTNQYVNLTSIGSGIHKFNYPEIKVSISGKIGVSTLTGQNFNSVILPIFSGEIQSVHVETGGLKYGSEDIINYNRQPFFELNSGSGIQVKPIISNGKIVDVLISSPGSGYNSPPNIQIIGDGVGAVLSPIFSNGSLIDVKIIYGGIGYNSNNTSIIITPSGMGAKFEAQIKSWKINLVERSIRTSAIKGDDGILTPGLNGNYGLQYSHAYAPRQLRSSVQATTFRQGKKFYIQDLIIEGQELTSTGHSPIIGWAYDGNPIYGPYGYSNKTGGTVKCLVSGYDDKNISPNRPGGNNQSIYPYGFFIEDYQYTGDGDLDEHNGRFSVTPEYPNGIYAYFSTISNGNPESSGIFANYKKPVFPYVIGPTYKSKPIDFNFDAYSNQDFIDINASGWKRNTAPYNFLSQKSSYDYILNPNTIRSQTSSVKTISLGGVDLVGITTGGQNYQVGDEVVFKTNVKFDDKAKAKVSLVKGKPIYEIISTISSFSDVVLYPNEQGFIGYTTAPHNYLNNDTLLFTGVFDYKKVGNIKVTSNNLILNRGVGSAEYTGILTYFNVAGNLNYPNIKENDIYQIGNEQIKILNIDLQSSRIKVLRNQNNTSGIVTYNAGIAITEKTKRFAINFGISTSYNPKVNKEFYFNPAESVGLGTSSGIGISSALYFSNPGVGITQITIPTQAIYLPSHNLITGDSLIYSSNGGSRISVSTNGTSSFQIEENSIIYVAKISNDLIGISTIKVGISSTGTFVGVGSAIGKILYFTSVGTGVNHSFKTNYENILTGTVSKNTINITTTEPHGLSLLNDVIVDALVGISTTIIVKYNDYNQRMVINPRVFYSINTIKNTININNHKYYTGQKVLYTSNTPADGLINQNMYYVIVVDSNTIMLSNSYYGATKNNPNIINIFSSSEGYLSEINPHIQIIKNQSIVFDLSDSSLSYFSSAGINTFSAFDLKIYKDNQFINEFDTTKSSSIFETSRSGKIGIDSNAKLTININDNTPSNLYYRLVPVNLQGNVETKKNITIDDEVISANKISIVESNYNGKHTVVGVSSTSFQFNILEDFSINTSILNFSKIEYYTNTPGVKGPIQEVSIVSRGRGYSALPGITSVLSNSGFDADLYSITNSIGKVTSTDIQDIGFEYSADYSIRPTSKYPSILVLDSLLTFDYIKITSFGKNYNSTPNLIVIDRLTQKVIVDVKLTYSLGDPTVTILKNTQELSNSIPKIIPINNSNGIKIKDISFNNLTKEVLVSLDQSFSNSEDFPFSIGSKILVEGVSVGITTTSRGYNSASYNYALFSLTSVTPAVGGEVAKITYNLSPYLNNNENPGIFNKFYSSGKIIPESYFPIFNPVLKKNNFYAGEIIYSLSETGVVESWNPDIQHLKVSTLNDFEINQKITGKTSGSVAVISKIFNSESEYEVDAYSLSKKGWNRETGFLNNSFQRIHDNDYYQYFSYSLRSKKDLSTWDNAVSTLNHAAGFKKFGNLIIESTPINQGISTIQNKGDLIGISDLSSFVSLNCVYDFDIVGENNINIDGIINSDEIIFNSTIIQDYIESSGNRVLLIDDISGEFNSNPRPTRFSIVDSFTLADFRSKKYLALIVDKTFTNQSQLNLITLIHDNSFAFLNEYGNINSLNNLGSFDFSISGAQGNLLFYPIKSKVNDYHVGLFSFSLNDISVGIGTLSLGNSVKIDTLNTSIPIETITPTTIVGIASTYRSAKLLIQIEAADSSYFEFDEITYIHNGTDVYFLDYGQLDTNNTTSKASSGVGTYNAYLSGSEVKIDFIPNNLTNVEYIVNTFNISLGTSISSGIGTQIIGGSRLSSSSIKITSTTPTIIGTYLNNEYNSSYSIISIEDTTNLEYQVSEFLTLSNISGVLESYDTEFGIIQTNSSLGIITAGISTLSTNIYFTPFKNSNFDVKVFKVDHSISDQLDELPFIKGVLNYDYGSYSGTDIDIKKDFYLNHKNIPIFQRYFDASTLDVVRVNSNSIRIPNHFYVTGEEVTYSYPQNDKINAIGISTTNIPGIGNTDKLPSSLYIVKLNDLDIQVAASSSDALKTIPNLLKLTHVGIGNSHSFISTNQNKKSVVSIDNLIQSPIVSTSVTTTLSKNVMTFDSEIYISDVSPFYSGDLIKINNEIMKVTSIGIGTTNSLSIIRPWLGTKISSHSSSNIVTKIIGNYNIIDNTIYFAEAPFGKIPFANPSNRPDEFDYVGIATGSSFNGRVFLRSGVSDTVNESYKDNYIFDNISDDFDGTQKSFTLTSNGSNISGISTNNAIILINNIFQEPSSPSVSGNYVLSENSGITSITFTGIARSTNYDVNTASIPKGGIILSVGSSQGFGYQPLVSAGGTAQVSFSGTIQSISIGNSGSGYRSGIQTIVNVGVKTENLETSSIHFIGTAAVTNGRVVGVSITNPGFGYTWSNPPIVVFDSPLSYSSIPLIYSSKSSAGVGNGAVIDIIVGQGSSIVSFELKNLGYGYKFGEILTVSIGGTLGIQTSSLQNFSEFQIFVDETHSDKFSAWTIGSLQIIDPLDFLFDGSRTTFPILIEGNQTTIRSRKGSNIDIQATLMIFINDVLQIPGKAYVFTGGSTIRFTEAPKEGDTSKILFYRGTLNVDTKMVDILETIKVGDLVTINSDEIFLDEDERLVTEIISSDTVNTNLYSGPGVTQDQNLLRPLIWCRQTDDLIVNGQQVGKDRIIYEPYIQPISNIIQNIGIATNAIFVESVKSFFDSEKEYVHDGTTEIPQNKIVIISQDTSVTSIGNAVISTSGTVSSVIISNPGVGYGKTPTVSISNPIGIGVSGVAKAVATLVNGSLSTIAITTGGFGYNLDQPPDVLIESPQLKYEHVDNISYEGDFGIIVGIKTTSIGVGNSGIIFNLFIPENSILRDDEIVKVGIATTGISGIQTSYYFVVNKSNIGNGIISLDSFGGIVGIGTTFMDNIYQVINVSIGQTNVVGVGITYVAEVTVRVSDYNNLSGFGVSSFYGEYSWGKISIPIRKKPQEFTSYAKTGGISTSPIIQRFNRLKYLNYTT